MGVGFNTLVRIVVAIKEGLGQHGLNFSLSYRIFVVQRCLLLLGFTCWLTVFMGSCAGNAEKQKSNSSFASAAMVQAALNAMASSASADPMEASSASLTPTTPLAAAVILQVGSSRHI